MTQNIETNEIETNTHIGQQQARPELENTNVEFGIELKDYLNRLEAEFAASGDFSDEELRQIKHDLNTVGRGEVEPKDAQRVSVTLLKVYHNMEAWQEEMRRAENKKTDAPEHYLSSKQIFLDSCRRLYPGEEGSLTLIGAEIYTVERQINGLTDPIWQESVSEIGNLEKLAEKIEDQAETEPGQAVGELEQILNSIDLGVQKMMAKEKITLDEQIQLNVATEVIYKVQTLIDKIKASEAYRNQDVAESRPGVENRMNGEQDK